MDAHIGKVVLPVARMGAGQVLQLLGTCFGISGRKLVTAAHVTGPSDQGLVVILGRTDSIRDYQDTTDNSANCAAVKLAAYDPIRDISILEIDGEVSVGYTLGGADDAAPGTPVVTVGYPHANHGRLVLTQQTSTVGARVLLGTQGAKTKHLVLNTQTRPGQSGGPVFSADGSRVYAMIVGGYAPSQEAGVSIGGIDPQTLHQTTHAVSAEYIGAML